MSNVLNLDSIDLSINEGKICMSAFPGRLGKSDFSYDIMESTFSYLENNKYIIMVSLIEENEFEQFLPKEQFTLLKICFHQMENFF